MTVRELTDAAYAVIGLYEGASIKSDLSDYESRAITLINILLGEISVIDCRIKREPATINRVSAAVTAVAIHMSDRAAQTYQFRLFILHHSESQDQQSQGAGRENPVRLAPQCPLKQILITNVIHFFSPFRK